MAKQSINVGTSPNDNRGDSLRISFQKINANFTELYTALGINADVTLNIGAFEFAGSVMSTTDSSAIVIDQATTITSNLSVGGDVLPTVANGGDLGSSARPWRSLYVSNNTIFLGGVSLSLDASNNLTVNGSRVGATSYADLTGKPSIPTSFSSLVNSTKTVSLASTGVLTLPNISTIDASVAQVGYSYGPYDIDIYYNTTGGALDSGHLTYIDIGVTAHNNLFNAPIAPRSTITGTIAANGNFTPGTPTVGTFTRFNLIRVGGVTIGSLEYRDDANPSAGLRIGPAGSTYTGPTVTAGTVIEGWSGRQTVAPKTTTYIRWADGSSTQVTGSQVRYPGEAYAGVVTTDNVSGKHFPATLYTANYSAATTAIGINTKQWQFDGNGTLTFPNQTTFGRNNAGDYALASFNDLVLKSKKSVTISSGEDIGALETSYTNSLVPLTSLLTALTYMGPGYPASHTSYAALAEAQATNPLISDELVALALTASDAWNAWQAVLNASAVTIGIGDKGWHFGADGKITLPGGGSIESPGGQSIRMRSSNIYDDPELGVNPFDTVVNIGDEGFSVYSSNDTTGPYPATAVFGYQMFDPTNPNFAIGLTPSTRDPELGPIGWTFRSDGSLTFPHGAGFGYGESGQLKVNDGVTLSLDLRDSSGRGFYTNSDGYTLRSNGSYSWTFGSDAILSLPQNLSVGAAVIQPNASTFGLKLISNGNIWAFGTNGSLTFPDATVQTTAWTGVANYNNLTNKPIIPQEFTFNVAADDSTLRTINREETIKFIGSGGIATSSDAEGNITITGSAAAAGSLTGTALASGVVSSSLTSVGTLRTLAVTGAVTAESFNTDQITVVGNRISTTVTNATLELEGNGSSGVVINTIAEATTASTSRAVGYLGLPRATSSLTQTLTIAESGKHVYISTAGQTITIPANSSVAYTIGTTITFIAGPSATTVSIAITSDTMYLAGTGTTGTRTLAAYGIATAVKVTATTWYINGTGLT